MDSHRHRHDSKSFVGFFVGDVHYAVPIAKVGAIANPLPVVALPHPPPAVCGVADYRDDVVPVVDLRVRFGLPAAEITRRTKWIVVDIGERMVALVVDAVTAVFGTGGTELRPPPALGGSADRRGIAGVTSYGGNLVFVLDPSRLRDLVAPLPIAGSLPPGPPDPLIEPRTGLLPALPKGAP